jgi:hypothetical protein
MDRYPDTAPLRFRVVGAGYAAQTAVNGASELLIFVPRAAHGHDLSLSFIAGGGEEPADTPSNAGGQQRMTSSSRHRLTHV